MPLVAVVADDVIRTKQLGYVGSHCLSNVSRRSFLIEPPKCGVPRECLLSRLEVLGETHA